MNFEIEPGLNEITAESFRVGKVHEFQEALQTTHIELLDLKVDCTAFDPIKDAMERFNADHVPETESKFYVTPELGDYENETVVGFRPYTSRSGNASYHGVFFGEMHFSDGSEMSVAVKPHDLGEQNFIEDRESCTKDYFANIVAKKLGFESLQPVGMIIDKDGAQYSITKLDETLDSFDTMDWNSFFADDFKNEGMKELWYKTALFTAMLHETGDSYHGDLAARNVATNPEGHVFLIDWEKGGLTNEPPLDIDARFGHTLIDVQSLMVSMVRPSDLKHNPGLGMFQHSTNRWEDFKEVFLYDYLEARLLHAAQGNHHMKSFRETQDELTQLEYTLEQKMDQLEEMFSPVESIAA